MEAQRKKVLQETRAKEQEKFRQMEERRKALELADYERREALKKKNLVCLINECKVGRILTAFFPSFV